MAFDVVLEGNVKLQRELKRLPDVVRRRILRPAVKRALSPITKDAKRRAPVRTGQLKRSIGNVVRTYKRSGIVWGGVGPRTGFKVFIDGEPVDPVHYAHLVELGTHGEPGHPFLRPALDANRARALAIVADGIRTGLDKEYRRG